MAYPYTVVTPHGDVHINSEHHHSAFASIDDFLKHNKTEVMAGLATLGVALGSASLAVASWGLYLSHYRNGGRLK